MHPISLILLKSKNFLVMEISDDSSCSDRNNTILSTNSPFPEDLIKNVSIFILKKHTKFERIIARAEKDFSVFYLILVKFSKSFFQRTKILENLFFKEQAMVVKNVFVLPKFLNKKLNNLFFNGMY